MTKEQKDLRDKLTKDIVAACLDLCISAAREKVGDTEIKGYKYNSGVFLIDREGRSK